MSAFPARHYLTHEVSAETQVSRPPVIVHSRMTKREVAVERLPPALSHLAAERASDENR